MLKITASRVKTRVVMFAAAAGFLAASALFISAVRAQESDIPQKLLPLAEELGCATRAACASSFTANFSKGLELAEKYNIYNAEQKTLAQSFKQEVLTKLTNVNEADFEQKIIEIANNLMKNKPGLAKQLGVDAKEVKAAETIVAELKSVGANLAVCNRPADTLAREELITCLNASRKLAERADEVEVYISEKNLTTATNALNLEESLRRGEYGNLGLTADEVGMRCLRPDSPAVCDEIASKFFGAQGVEMLKKARTQVTQTEDFYRQNVKDYTFTTPDGQTLVGKEAIGAACKGAFEEKNVTLARVCGEFAVKNGFASQEDVDRSLKLVQAVVDTNINFDVCNQNPAACNTYIPDELRNEFDVMQKIDDIMRQEMGFDPMQCEQSAMNPEIGKKCLEASMRALPQIEAISASSKEAQQLIANIKKQITSGGEVQDQKNKIQQELTVSGGPGGCKNEEECNKFCAKPENGAECLTFGAKKGFYKEAEVAQRFEIYNQQFTAPVNQTYQQTCPMNFPAPCPTGQHREQQIMNNCPVFGACILDQGKGIQPPMQQQPLPPTNQGICTGSQIRCFSPGSLEGWCQIPPCPVTPVPMPTPATPTPTTSMPSPCPSGNYWNGTACVPTTTTTVSHTWTFKDGQTVSSSILSRTDSEYSNLILRVDAQCRLINKDQFSWLPNAGNNSPENWMNFGMPNCMGTTTVSPPATTSCTGSQIWCPGQSGGPGWCQVSPCPITTITTNPPSTTCPTGQYWYVPAGGTGYCRTGETSTTCPSGNYWNGTACVPSAPIACTSSQIRCYSGSADSVGWCQIPPCPITTTPSPTPTPIPTPAPSTTCPEGNYWDGNACVPSTPPSVTPLPAPTPTPTPTPPPTCPEGNYWSGSACVPSTPPTCPEGNYWSGSACVPSTPPTCPEGNYWSGSACVPSTPSPSSMLKYSPFGAILNFFLGW